jgi:ELWxxDGT repeat protein
MLSWLAQAAVAGTSQILRDIKPGPMYSAPGFGLKLGDVALFAADDGTGSGGLWRSDGTPAGTQRVGQGAPVTVGRGPVGAMLGSVLIYTGMTAAGAAELWRTDGTSAGTVLLLDVSGPPVFSAEPQGSNPGSCGVGYLPVGAQVFYGASPSGIGKLFRTDGTAAGSIELGAFPYATPSSKSEVCVLAGSGGYVYFSAVNPQGTANVLWRSNGQPGVNEQVVDANGMPISAPYTMVEMNGSLYFFAYGQQQTFLWRLTPADPVARMVLPKNWTWPTDSSVPGIIGVLGNTLLFRDYEFVDVNTLAPVRMYRSDGTPAGTYVLSPSYTPHAMGTFGVQSGNRFFYTGPSDPTGLDLWVTDGTKGGTTSIRIAGAGDQSIIRPEFFIFDGMVHFAVQSGGPGDSQTQLWRSDGTVTGTVRVTDVPVISRSMPGTHFVVAGGRLLFPGFTDAFGEEPWAYDAAPASSGGPGGSNSGGGNTGNSDSGGGAISVVDLLAIVLIGVWRTFRSPKEKMSTR